LSAVFSCVPAGTDLNGDGAPDTLLDALNYPGGNNLAGARQILLRAGVASLLNACEFGSDFGAPGCPTTTGDVISRVCAAWNTANQSRIIAEAKRLDDCNNSRFCPLN
jgi:hypothetical protein